MDFKWEGRDFVRATVSGKMTSGNIRKACAAKKLVPVCDHTSYFDGQCVVAGSNVGWHFSHPSNVAKQDGLDQSKLLGLYFYAPEIKREVREFIDGVNRGDVRNYRQERARASKA